MRADVLQLCARGMDSDSDLREVDCILDQVKRTVGVIEAHAAALTRLTEAGDDGAAWMRINLDEAAAALNRVVAAHRGLSFSRGDRQKWWSWYFADYRQLPRSEAERRVDAIMNEYRDLY